MSETRGSNSNNNSTTAFGGIQEATFYTPTDLDVTEILWDLHSNSGNFELRVDGSLINTRTSVSGLGVDMLSGASPITIARGEHTISITRTSGSNGWRYRNVNSWVDGWFHMGYWISAGGGETPGVRITATPTDYINDGPAASWSSAGVARVGITYNVTPAANIYLVGVGFTQSAIQAMEVFIDGVSVGTNAGWTAGTSTSFPGSGSWVGFTSPYLLTASVSFELKIRRPTSATWTGQPFNAGTSDTSDLGYFTQGEWQEAVGNTPAVRLYFEELPDTPTPIAIATTTTVPAPSILVTADVTPSAITTTTSLGAPAIIYAVNPDGIVTITTVDAPSLLIDSIATPTVITTTTTVHAPAVIADLPKPDEIETLTTVHSVTVTTVTLVTPAAIGTIATVPAPDIAASLASNVKLWNGTTWETVTVKRWDGADWVSAGSFEVL